MSEKRGTKATAYKNRFNSENYDRMNLVVPKGRKADIEAHAKSKATSVNGLVNDLLRVDMGLSAEEWRRAALDRDNIPPVGGEGETE